MQPLLVCLLAAGWGCLYAHVILRGQTVPDTVELRDSWLFPGRPAGETVDAHRRPDWNVWSDYKRNAGSVAGLMGAYLLLARLASGGSRGHHGEAGGGRRTAFACTFGALFVVAMHGVCGAVLVASIAALNYALALALRDQVLSAGRSRVGRSMCIIWCFNVAVMFFIFEVMAEEHPGGPLRVTRFLPQPLASLPFMVGFHGLGPWHAYRYTCLRLISFACDSISAQFAHEPAVKDREPSLSVDKVTAFVKRVTDTPHDAECYFGSRGIILYIAYVTYPPLYFAGPVLSYNGFVAQLERPSHLQSARDLGTYAIGILVHSVILEISLQFFYYPGWLGSEAPLELLLSLPLSEITVAMHSLINFEFMSLLVIWRVQRLVAALDGIEVFENMTRNINFVCSFQDLWRIWNASLNRFAIRYIYVPLGGKSRPLLGVLVTFIFIAFWHEVGGAGTATHWYIWGVLNFLCVVFEKVVVVQLRLLRKGQISVAVVGAVTYQLMLWANIPALTTWDVSYSLWCRLAYSWATVAPPVLYGLQGIIAESAARRQAD